MINVDDKAYCSGCYACVNSCLRDAITMEDDAEGFWYPKVDVKKCTQCGLCEKSCTTPTKKKLDYAPVAYAIYNKNKDIRSCSSSGGIFTLIAEQVIDDGGVVFGAMFDDNFDVVHGYAETKKDVVKFRGSKYVQSKIGSSYNIASDFLKQGRKVLFSGTPCQIWGLKSYLGREYGNLLCQDIICHGVPSPMVWQKYVAFREKAAGAELQAVSFRDKKKGWLSYSLSMLFKNSVKYTDTIFRDKYLVGFNQNLYLRPSCYTCRHKGEQRESDITLADFWGVQSVVPDMDDDKGISLVMINTPKGENLVNNIEANTIFRRINLKDAITYNPAMVKSMELHPHRQQFFEEISDEGDFDKLTDKFCGEKRYAQMKREVRLFLKRTLKRLKTQ